MAFDGSGVFMRLRNWVADAAAGVKIRADFHDTEDNNFADGLTNCITKDGQTTITQNIKFNSKRVVALADPIDPQDAATKAYADTKASLSGGATFSGPVTITGATTITGAATITGALSVSGTVSASGYGTRAGTAGTAGGNFVNFNWTGGNLEAWVDITNLGALATQVYANSAAASKLPIAGGTITGNLAVSGELVAAQNYIRFGYSGSPGYLIWQGGSSYSLGGAGVIWHSGNFNPNASNLVSNARLVFAGDYNVGLFQSGVYVEPYGGAVVTGLQYIVFGDSRVAAIGGRYRYLQLFTTGWFTIGYA